MVTMLPTTPGPHLHDGPGDEYTGPVGVRSAASGSPSALARSISETVIPTGIKVCDREMKHSPQ
jgi:hypothetical protein